jgi:protein-S-isoprenylcysteine O-methyltransferase Ste14
MNFILIGCLAFILFYLFDLNKIKYGNKYINMLFAAGVILLAVSTASLLLGNYRYVEIPIILKVLFGALSVCSLILLLSALFAALPYGDTYVKAGPGTVVDSGMYALCRHPGVVWFFLFYLFLWLASGRVMVLRAGAVWTTMDLLYAYLEDRWIFPKTLNGYCRYQLEVPFLIPKLTGLKKYFLQ